MPRTGRISWKMTRAALAPSPTGATLTSISTAPSSLPAAAGFATATMPSFAPRTSPSSASSTSAAAATTTPPGRATTNAKRTGSPASTRRSASWSSTAIFGTPSLKAMPPRTRWPRRSSTTRPMTSSNSSRSSTLTASSRGIPTASRTLATVSAPQMTLTPMILPTSSLRMATTAPCSSRPRGSGSATAPTPAAMPSSTILAAPRSLPSNLRSMATPRSEAVILLVTLRPLLLK
mmetsp:Transcript_26126/g.61001  ORF Transcript_26126/g.61001 Transcript_26126/m.61001 type:complete len:234 (+) Transcript_26126:479-1180(+)